MDRSENDNLKSQPNKVKKNAPEVQTTTIPVIEEKLLIEKRNIKKGTLRVHKKIKEEQVNVNVLVDEDELDVEHVSVNQYVDTPPAIRQDGETTIVPVMREVVEKRLILVEELHITKRKVKENKTQKVTLRKEEVKVDYIEEEPAPDFPENKT